MGSSVIDSDEILRQTLAGFLAEPASLHRIVFSKPAHGEKAVLRKITVRPVKISGRTMFQVSAYDAKKSTDTNHDLDDASAEIGRILGIGFGNISVLRSDNTILLERLSNGSTRMHTGKPQAGMEQPDLAHDRKKKRLIMPENAAETLSALGFLTASGEIKPTMQKKYRQVNEFIRIIEGSSLLLSPESEILEIADCGCGNAYLTFALYHHLSVTRCRTTRMIGIDKDAPAVVRNNEMARKLGFAGLSFTHDTIGGYAPDAPPGAVLSLHACDTATDDAIAKGILWKSRLIVCAPCCHHHLNHQLKAGNDSLIARSLSRHGLLLEKLGDTMTDVFRAQILSLMGYDVSTIKFVDPESTERNLLLKAEWTGRRVREDAVSHYQQLKSLLKVTPYLEEALGEMLTSHLGMPAAQIPEG